jgi:hypothetical protein
LEINPEETMSYRSYTSLSWSGVHKTWAFGGLEPYSYYETSYEENDSLKNAGPPYRGGGPWFLVRSLVTGSPGSYFDDSQQGEYCPWYVVNYTPKTGLGNHTVSELNAMGTHAIAQTEPTKSAVDMSVALGELMHDGLPHLPLHEFRERVKVARDAGKEYLNWQFGWAPLMSDLKKFATSVLNSHQMIAQYRKGANQSQRRRFDFPIRAESASDPVNTIVWQPGIQSFGSGFYNTYRYDRTWFVGRFVYYLPVDDSLISRMTRYRAYASKLYGVRATPEVIWNLAPWSWAADWFGDIGDVVHNASALGTDSLVMQEGWMCSHTISEDVMVGTASLSGPGASASQASKRYFYETKTRIPATPYGFGFDMSSLSGRQSAILAAIGVSRQGHL